MKKYLILCLIIFLFAFTINAEAQVVWEHTYDSASTIAPGSGFNQLMIVNFEISGDRYVKIDRWGKTIKIYDINHSIIKSINIAAFSTDGGTPGIGDLLYFSETLFNTDNKMEFMYIRDPTISSPYPITYIYNEDGNVIFSDTGAAMIRLNFEQQQFPIYNTSMGTKMILSYDNGQAKVFSLPGTLSTAIAEANGQLMQQNGAFSNLYPNPSNGSVTLQYELPKEERQGELILYNMQGTEIKRYKVDNTFKDILLDNTQLPAGTYFYQLQTKKGAVGTKKMVVIK